MITFRHTTKNSIMEFKGKYRFLSNFFLHSMEYQGYVFKSVEHFYQSMKTTNENDFYKILGCQKPADAKRLGANVHLRPDWEQIKHQVMELGLSIKFSDEKLGVNLLKTGNMNLIEGNYWGDTYWGVDLNTYQGLNVLGLLLMLNRCKLNCEL